MRRMVVETLAMALVLTGASISLLQAQQAPQAAEEKKPAEKGYIRRWDPQTGKAKSKLEDMLDEALRNNPDIRVAAAKVAEADAELNRTRLLVTQKVIALHHGMLSQKAAVDYAQKKYERLKQLSNQGAVDSALLEEAQQALMLAKAKLAELEAQMPAVLGKVTHAQGKVSDALVGEFTVAGARFYPLIGPANLIRTPMGDLELRVMNSPRAAGPVADKIRTALDKPVSLKVENKLIPEVLLLLQKQTGLNIKHMTTDSSSLKVNLELTDVSLRAALEYIEDIEGGYRFVIREYGILYGPTAKLPPGALTVQEFLRQGKTPTEKK